MLSVPKEIEQPLYSPHCGNFAGEIKGQMIDIPGSEIARSTSQSPTPHGFLLWQGLFRCFLAFLMVVEASRAQATTTDPTDAVALNTIFRKWNITANPKWNITGELCTGAATDSTKYEDRSVNPLIKCDCTFQNNSLCHITHLRVYGMSVTGPIPVELTNLTFLTNLNLAQNFLSGPFPAFIGNLSKMKYFTVGINSLSGMIPKEIGNLKDLMSLSFGSNYLSGPLPSEIGNLTKLQQLYMSSSGVSGEIPSTFAQMQSLQIIWASDNKFTGRIPNFIGGLTELTVLRLQGNSFQGPIPSSFANLTKLQDLRIGDLINGSSSLEFIKDMKSLSTLILRNSHIYGTIPSSFSDYASLNLLDLSFNSLTGSLPDSLFSSRSLRFLFLGNNSFSGNLPASKSSQLANIDLSYNNLSGSFPSWISDKNLKLNLVANNFVIDTSNGSVLPFGLNCLQKNFPCYRGSPIWSSFAIDCGGSENVMSTNGTAYDMDNENLNTSSYYVSGVTRWGVSSVGLFVDTPNASYIEYSSSQTANTLDSKLFQSARLSSSSLRYYGLGLENGNYNVKLQFSETAFPNSPSWKSVGRRIFDIFIQGNLVVKDFNIRKEADGSSFQAVEKNYGANVTDNFLEIHLFWAGRGTCCIPIQGYYGPSISAISVTPNFIPTVRNQQPTIGSSKKHIKGLIVGVAVSIAALGTVLIFAFFLWRQKRLRVRMANDEELLGLAIKPDMFSYAELRTATTDFNPNNKLGEGGFGPVYKGKLSDGRLVAVKRLKVASNQGKKQFITEIATVSAVKHRNLVKLYGCCCEGDNRLLVYEYLENKSLDQALFGKSSLHLDWPTRFNICLDIAKGLAYLHEESSVRIVHRDVKASNVLLDSNLTPKISDFGLAKLYDDNKTHISTRIAGTIGYLAPEYALRGHLTEKADVFSFGILALEILTGRSNADATLTAEKTYLIEWAWHLHENKCDCELVDPTLLSYNEKAAIRVIGVALLCAQSSPSLRPPMSRVVSMLVGDVEVTKVASRPGYVTELQFKEVGISFFSDELSGSSTVGTAGSQAKLSSSQWSTTGYASSPSDTLLQEEKI